ncbi:endonuclease/exonuclease/phosphatase family protein [Kosakonia cowanii]|uniref:endonuclease/exonuclease/phosphatase family protein n=1 Tax=Kosakonia cowanii TaxID=208223 RepID=UPI0012FD546B|nr:endonuclease/exonuclease/phosphatase family protein [Kosakonia cowanii]
MIVDANFGGDDVILFLSHWNSAMFQGGVKKSHCAGRLRDKIDARFRNKHEHLILMGDYNAQPFDRDMVVELETSKDIDIVFESPRVLYNPFWRNLDSRTKNIYFQGVISTKKISMTNGKLSTRCFFHQDLFMEIHGD